MTEYFEHTTYEAAEKAMQDTIADITGDNSEIGEDDIAYAAMVSVALQCTPAVCIEFCRCNFGEVPDEVSFQRPDLLSVYE